VVQTKLGVFRRVAQKRELEAAFKQVRDRDILRGRLGPGAYGVGQEQLNSRFRRTVGSFFGKEKRAAFFERGLRNTPGPGSYRGSSLPDSRLPTLSPFKSVTKRSSLILSNIKPGPGSYLSEGAVTARH
jgi:hypothetical protein